MTAPLIYTFRRALFEIWITILCISIIQFFLEEYLNIVHDLLPNLRGKFAFNLQLPFP